MNLNLRERFNVSYNADHVTPQQALSLQIDIANGFLYNAPDTNVKPPKLQGLLAAVQQRFGELTVQDFSRGRSNVNRVYVNDRVKIYANGNAADIFLETYTKSECDSSTIWQVYCEHIENDDDVLVFMHSYSKNGASVDAKIRCLEPKEFESVSTEFYPYIDVPTMFDRFFTGDENILLLVGEPGLGKSKLATAAIKHAYNNPDHLPYDKKVQDPSVDEQFILVAYVKSPEVLASDSFWRILQQDPPDFCILDDQDFMLTRRDAEVLTSDDTLKNAFLNQFLSFTDGVERNNTKFIITTNQSYDHIDSAVLRKGRLFDILELRSLHLSEAREIWTKNGLDVREFDSIFTDARVLPADLGSEISKRKNVRIADAQKDYILEAGISKTQIANTKKRISI